MGKFQKPDQAAQQAPSEAMIVQGQSAAENNDGLAVLYDNGAEAPEITVTEASAGVFTVSADGAPVAVVASSEAPEPAEIRVIERNPDGTAPPLPHSHATWLN